MENDMDAKLKEKIEACTTEKQVRRVLAENGMLRQIVRDDTEEIGRFSVWIDDLTRIYHPHRRAGERKVHMVVQKWHRWGNPDV